MFREFRSAVEAALAEALTERGYPTDDLGIEEPPGDVDAPLASSVAFRLASGPRSGAEAGGERDDPRASEAGAPPPQVAEEVAAAIDVDAVAYLARVETTGPYLNFHVTDAYYADTLAAARDPEYGRLDARDESVVVEHTSANPTGPIHVGRARNPILGDAIANALEYAGYDVDRHYYVNDAGRQMAVFTWAYETLDEDDLPEPERDRPDFELVRYYRKGNEVLAEGEEAEVEAAEAEIQEILRGLEEGDDATYERVTRVVDAVLDGMRESLARLPATFDAFVKETRFMRDGSCDDVAERLKRTDEASLEEGAWQLDLSAFGYEKKLVFLRSDGTSLYTTRDLAHHEWKFDEYDRAVTVLGEDHKLQAGQLRAALELLGNDTDRLSDVFYSYVNLPEGKMSTRAGTAVNLDDLLDEAVDRARKEVERRMESRIRADELTDADIERIAEQVGIGAVRYDIVAKQPGKGITFEWEHALDFDAQSAPYVQYVHARCCGILAEAESRGIEPSGSVDPDALATGEARDLLSVLARFPAVVETAAEDLEPHRVATYTRELAETYNAFYRECPVLDAGDDATRDARLALVAASRHAVANALDVLGVAAPESM